MSSIKADSQKNINNMKKQIAKMLLSVKAVELRPEKLFTWASGIKSPIYCDNRKILSYPESRKLIKTSFSEFIKKEYPDVNTIAGVATGAIAHGVLVAEELNLPFVYVRAKAKEHGQQNLIEGKLPENAKVVVIEDLISTGGSSLAAVKALEKQNTEVLGLLAVFSYGFDISKEKFKEANCKLDTLTDYSTLSKVALEEKYINDLHVEILSDWQKKFISK